MCLDPSPTNEPTGISGRFTGWPEQALDLLLELDGEPPVSVRESLREERERLIRQPMVALMQDLAHIDAAYSDFHVPGFRRTLGSWQRQVSFLRAERNIDQRVWLDLDGLSVQGPAGTSIPVPGSVPDQRASWKRSQTTPPVSSWSGSSKDCDRRDSTSPAT